MGSIYELIICFVFIVFGVVKTIKYINIFKKHSVEIPAVIKKSEDLDSSYDDPFQLEVEYTYLSKLYNVILNAYIFAKPKAEEIIRIKIDPDNPQSALYYGINNRFYYVRIIGHVIIILAFSIYFFYWVVIAD